MRHVTLDKKRTVAATRKNGRIVGVCNALAHITQQQPQASGTHPHGMVPPRPCLYAGGGQRNIWLASGTCTGESRRDPLGGSQQNKCCYINGLSNHDLGVLDSFAEARVSSLRKPSPLPEATLTSARKPARPYLSATSTLGGEAGQLRPAPPPQRQGLRPYRSTPVRPPGGRNPSDSVS